MIIGINTIGNSITLKRSMLKKTGEYFREFKFDYSLVDIENKIRAINETLTEEVVNEINEDKGHVLLVPDELVFSDIMEFPPLSKGKVQDIFNTRFKILFTQTGGLYLSFKEVDRSGSQVVIQYILSNVKNIKRITDTFFEHGIIIKSIDYFSHHYISQFIRTNSFTLFTLLVGPHSSELLIHKGDNEVLSHVINYGEEELFNGKNYLSSIYGEQNDEAKKYASYIKKNFASSVQATDEDINNSSIDEEYNSSLPREIRVLKDQALENYVIKHNFKLLHGLVCDCIDTCMKSSWRISNSSIRVVGSQLVVDALKEAAIEETNDLYIKAEYEYNDIISKPVVENPFFDSGNIITEKTRRKFEWSKFLTMEIGKKKKD